MAKELTPEQIKKLKADKAAKIASQEVIIKSISKEKADELVQNKEQLLALKKAATKFTDSTFGSKHKLDASKLITDLGGDNLKDGIIKRTVVGNTYGWFDSHGDVHIPGIFSKSIQENKNIFHLHDHRYEVAAKVGTPLKVYEQSINLDYLGLSNGFATCLLMDTEIKSLFNPMVYDQYLTNQINQHSVGMQYVKLYLCIDNADYKEEKANYDTYINYVINKSDVEEAGYFWAVTEAKLKEISCVLMGSNELTPTIEPNKITQEKKEPANTTHKINYEYLKSNLK